MTRRAGIVPFFVCFALLGCTTQRKYRGLPPSRRMWGEARPAACSLAEARALVSPAVDRIPRNWCAQAALVAGSGRARERARATPPNGRDRVSLCFCLSFPAPSCVSSEASATEGGVLHMRAISGRSWMGTRASVSLVAREVNWCFNRGGNSPAPYCPNTVVNQHRTCSPSRFPPARPDPPRAPERGHVRQTRTRSAPCRWHRFAPELVKAHTVVCATVSARIGAVGAPR